MVAKIIIFDGPDNVGKSTHGKLLRDELPNAYYIHSPFYLDYDRGYSCKLIRDLLQNGLAISEPKTFQKIFVDNRSQWLIEEFSHLKKSWDFIIIDRWTLSTYIYGIATGLSEIECENLIKDHNIGDLQFIFRPSDHRKNSDSFEIELHDKVTHGYNTYIDLIEKYPNQNWQENPFCRFNKIINSRIKPIADTHKEILTYTKQFFKL